MVNVLIFSNFNRKVFYFECRYKYGENFDWVAFGLGNLWHACAATISVL